MNHEELVDHYKSEFKAMNYYLDRIRNIQLKIDSLEAKIYGIPNPLTRDYIPSRGNFVHKNWSKELTEVERYQNEIKLLSKLFETADRHLKAIKKPSERNLIVRLYVNGENASKLADEQEISLRGFYKKVNKILLKIAREETQ